MPVPRRKSPGAGTLTSPSLSTAHHRHCRSAWIVTKRSSRYHVSPIPPRLRRSAPSFSASAVMRAFGHEKCWLLPPMDTCPRVDAGRFTTTARRRLFKAYVPRRQLDRSWSYTTRDAVARFLFAWLNARRRTHF